MNKKYSIPTLFLVFAATAVMAKEPPASAAAGGSGAAMKESKTSNSYASFCPKSLPTTNPLPITKDKPTAKQICSEMRFIEGPLWDAAGNTLYFSEFQNGRPDLPSHFYRYTEKNGCEIVLKELGTNGLALDQEGKILAASHGKKAILTIDQNKKTHSALVSDYKGARFSSPNDLAVRSDGTIYFTDPAYEVGVGVKEELPRAVYRRAPDGKLDLVADLGTAGRPNGITLSPDETRLFVSDSIPGVPGNRAIRQYKVNADGSTDALAHFIEGTGSDGMVTDCAGNLYLTTNGAVSVYSPDAVLLGTIAVAEAPSNVAFGGADRKTLFITARTSLYAIELALPGYPY